jgi:hypothetical protein
MSEFVFKSCLLDKEAGIISAKYEIIKENKVYNLEEKISFNRKVTSQVPDEIINRTLTLLHICLGVSYWKMFCLKDIKFASTTLDSKQAKFFDTVYTKGLGEFFYKNLIDFRGLVNFPSQNSLGERSGFRSNANCYLLGLGGGKDSIVSAEMLLEKKIPFELFVVETNKKYKVIDEVGALINVPIFKVQREVDTKTLINIDNKYDGHIPISFVYATLAIVACIFYNYKGFLTSNESSADSGNLEYLNTEINHQWSKSTDFELMFQEYVKYYICIDLEYRSLLRNMTEFQILEKFAKFKKYFYSFSSCNRNFSISNIRNISNDRWCGHCPKCAFVFLLLSAYIDEKTVISIFGQNLFDKPELLLTYKDLAGLGNHKPFDCVGTFEEVNLALKTVIDKGLFKNSYILKNIFN